MFNKIGSNAGHGKQDSKSCGTIAIVKESIEDRLITTEFNALMKKEGKTIHNCTIDYPASKQDCLNQIINKCNSLNLDIVVSHHINSGRKDLKGDGSIGGIEVWVSSKNSKAYEPALRVCREHEKLGFKNRGVKIQPEYSIIKNTKAPCMIIEYFFADDKDDCDLYKKIGHKALAKAAAQGILNKTVNTSPSVSDTINDHVNSKFVNGSYASKYAIVTTDSLRVRHNRGTKHKQIGSVKKNQKVKLEYCLNGWVSIHGFNGQDGLGYVSTEYLKLV